MVWPQLVYLFTLFRLASRKGYHLYEKAPHC